MIFVMGVLLFVNRFLYHFRVSSFILSGSFPKYLVHCLLLSCVSVFKEWVDEDMVETDPCGRGESILCVEDVV